MCLQIPHLYGNGNISNSYLKRLSVVSKQFLSITNLLRFSLTIRAPKHFCFLRRLFHRFSNLNSLNLSIYYGNDINLLFIQISLFPLKLRSLHLSNTPTNLANGLRAFSQNVTTLTSLTFFNVNYIDRNDFFLIADCFPDLQSLGFKYCHGICNKGIGCVLWRCCNIRHLNFTGCSRVKLHGMNFEVLKLEVLNLSHTRVDDEKLYVISKSCRGLLQLSLESCLYVTQKGVKHVVENCTQLRVINLRYCYKVHADFVASIVFSRSSLRKIFVPFSYHFKDRERELFSRHHGCLVC
ncbi:putative leucine-rich repeat domain, L domain-containing protein [Medicago truncatula]|uniref:F-box/LRR protein, putative n=1 Tax=Medicago truncatula TaxID=3880 RepID=A0A072VCZ4_MEDTR|nr:F-box/LRR protein, putative [Medicago truncatula]RHN70854.1 putative leucine-rich repeat domain, L domain-containing protein [Medicago truncatula]